MTRVTRRWALGAAAALVVAAGVWTARGRKPRMGDGGSFEVLPAGEMREKYGLYAEARPVIVLNSEKVPESLRHLIPLAERFGISDDLIREDYVDKTPASDMEELRRLVRESEGLLMEWLAGPAADGPEYTDEYIAFSALLMAYHGG